MSVFHKGTLIQWVTVERGIKFGIDQNRDAAANCWRLAPVTHASRAASSPEIFRPFLTVCLTVFPFEFRPRTFTIGFYRKKSFISELMILECSFPLRWLGTVVTSHTGSNRQAYTPVMSMLQKAVQRTHCTSCNQPAHTNAIMLYAVKLSSYVVGPFLCRILHKSWSTGVKMWQNCLVCQNEHGDIWIFFANPFL